MTPPRQSVGDGYGPGEIVVRKISDEGPQWMAEWHDAMGHPRHLTVAGGTAEDASRHAYVYRDGREKPPVLAPRKWTAADVTKEDRAHLLQEVSFTPFCEGGNDPFAIMTAAFWNRLEEKRAAFEGGSIHLLRELEALEHNRESLVERHGLPGYRLKFPQMDEAIAEIKSRISGSDSGGSERQAVLPSTDDRQTLLAQALETLDSVASESQLQLDHPQFPISDKNCDLIRAVMDQLPCKGWSIGGNEAQNLRAMAQYDEDHKPEAIAALEKEVGA